MSNFLSLVLVLCFVVALMGCKKEQVIIPAGTSAEQIIAMQVAKKQI